MKLSVTKKHRLSKLHDEILAAVPELRPITVDGERFPRPVMIVSGDGDSLEITLPDDAPRDAVLAVIDAHNPEPVDAPVVWTLEDRVRALVEWAEGQGFEPPWQDAETEHPDGD